MTNLYMVLILGLTMMGGSIANVATSMQLYFEQQPLSVINIVTLGVLRLLNDYLAMWIMLAAILVTNHPFMSGLVGLVAQIIKDTTSDKPIQ